MSGEGAGGAGLSRRDGVDYAALKLETHYRKLWLERAYVQHLLPQAGELRSHSTDGVLVRTTSFERPEGSSAMSYVIHALFPLGEGKFLIFFRSNVRDGNTVRAFGDAAVHGPDGRMLSTLAGADRFAVLSPAIVNDDGECIFHRVDAATGKFTLWKADLLLQE
ncbi:MAG: hypothetical protein ACUVXB_15075 [Bryobacteraceae bacterium]